MEMIDGLVVAKWLLFNLQSRSFKVHSELMIFPLNSDLTRIHLNLGRCECSLVPVAWLWAYHNGMFHGLCIILLLGFICNEHACLCCFLNILSSHYLFSIPGAYLPNESNFGGAVNINGLEATYMRFEPMQVGDVFLLWVLRLGIVDCLEFWSTGVSSALLHYSTLCQLLCKCVPYWYLSSIQDLSMLCPSKCLSDLSNTVARKQKETPGELRFVFCFHRLFIV